MNLEKIKEQQTMITFFIDGETRFQTALSTQNQQQWKFKKYIAIPDPLKIISSLL